jgi:heat-inducible transcriptional repressor
MKTAPPGIVERLNDRSREIFREIVEAYVASGEPVGSRTISRRLAQPLSPATIRNVMSDLEDAGLIYAPHTSAGRLPTEAGLRLFVNGLLQIGDLTRDERTDIESRCAALGKNVDEALTEASSILSGLSHCAGLVIAPKADKPLKHAEFVNLGDGRALVVMVMEDGIVENRLIELPVGTPPSALTQATNYINSRLMGRTLAEAQGEIAVQTSAYRAELDRKVAKLVEAGLALWADDQTGGSLIVRGQSKLLEEVSAMADLEHVRKLFEALETNDLLVRLLDVTEQAEGVQIYIGADNELFNLAGCSMVVAPFTGSRNQIVGAIGVIGPTRINYARIIPIVDYTAKVVSRIVG